jgi:hypothetical protein
MHDRDEYYRELAQRAAAIQRRADALGARRDPDLARYLALLEASPLDTGLARITTLMLGEYEEQQRLAPNWLTAPPTSDDLYGGHPPPDFEIGQTIETAVRYGPRMSGECGSIVITGISGGGKTSAVQNIIVGTHRHLYRTATLVFDVKGDYTCTAALAHPAVHVVKLRTELPLRLVRPPAGVSLDAWLPTVATYLCEYRGLKKSRHVFLDAARRLCRHFGVDRDPTRPWPSFHNVYDFLRGLRGSKFGKEAEYRASLINELQGLLEDSGRTFDTSDGVDVDQHLLTPGGVTVLQLETLPTPAQQLIIALLVERLIATRSAANVHNPGLRVLIILDEAQQVLSHKADWEASNGIAPLASQLLRARETGIGFIVVPHLLPDTSRAVLAAAKSMLVVGGLSDAASIDIAARMMNLSPQAKTMIPRLGRGQALVREIGQGDYTDAFLVDLDPPVLAKAAVAEPERQRRTGPCLARLPRAPSRPLTDYPAIMAELNTPWSAPAPVPGPAPTAPTLTPALRDLLFDCARHRDDWMKERRVRLKIADYKVLQGLAQALEAQGLVRQHTIRLGKTTYALLEVTDYGWQTLGQAKPAHYRGHGGLVHTVLMERVARHLTARQWTGVRSEFAVGPAQHAVDVYGRSPAGVPTAFEVTLSTSNVVSNALHTLTAPSVVRELIFLAPLQKECAQVLALLQQDAAVAPLLGRIQCRRVDEFLS